MKKSSWWWIVAIIAVVIILLILISQGALSGLAASARGKCTDTDGGISTYQAGTCTDRTGSYSDYCQGNFSPLTGEKIAEYYCRFNKCTMKPVGCPPYKTCVNGGCYDPGNIPGNSSG